ncbi:uncharacterized protein BDV17DRAFT_300974 [Aspergillus undulatus]|uniref:uncharacterized protein n=1 Tax=Aspergillus undulatus TaxID=1810928 RepID=UPI003CCD7F7E
MALGDIVTNVDIVAVPAIGAEPERAWTGDGAQSPWVTTELPRFIPNARVLLMDHGELDAEDTLESLGTRLLNNLQEARKASSRRRPLFFLCHSTGGNVATAALVQASRSPSPLDSIFSSCYGIAFFGTPHYGSSYLSVPEFGRSIRRLLRLKYTIPLELREVFKPRHETLERLTGNFRGISADMKIWTFLETVDSVFTITDTETASTIDMHVPITSIRSGLLGFEHESELPLAADHVGIASFQGQENTARMDFIRGLQESITTALELSILSDVPLQVEQEVMVHVNGFFEDTARGISRDSPLQLWSTKTPLDEFLNSGPIKCLEERLKKSSRLSSSTYDDSEPSEVGSRPTSSHAQSSQMDSRLREPDLEVVPSRPSVRRSRSFLAQRPSPRIHVIEPPIEGYFDIQSDRSTSEPRFSPEDAAEEEGEDDENEVSDNLGTISPSQRNLLSSLSSRYREFLNVPFREKTPEERPRIAPRFDRPEPGTEKMMWIHVPYTHTDWVPPVLSKTCKGQTKKNLFRKLVNADNWYSNLITARHLEPHARYVRPDCIHFKLDSPPIKASEPHDPQLALYLHWDTYWNVLQRRRVIEERLRQGRSRPVADEISQSSLESKLIWKYLGNEPPIHIRRTLDQFGYPNLRSTVARDDDQMLWKRTRKSIDLRDDLAGSMPLRDGIDPQNPTFVDGKVLMVDQLWLWIVDQNVVVTFFPKQEPTTVEGKFYEQTNLFNSIYNELNGDLARRFETSGDLAALIVLHAVTILFDRTLHKDLQVLRIFEESISILTELTTKSFKKFRNRGFITRPSEYNKTPDGKLMTAAEREDRDREVAQQNRDDLSSMLELRDIADELGTIMKLLEQQTTTVKDMLRYFEHRGYGKRFIHAALTRLDEYRTHINEMRENAIAAQKAVENLLDLKQKQANVDESRLARWEAEVTQSQSRAVMVFTIFTVIFLPLSFFTSLFGINAREWSGEPTNLTLRTMLTISGPTSAAVIVSALLIAFSERLRDSLLKSQKILFGLAKEFIFIPVRTNLHLTKSHKTSKSKIPDKSSLASTTRTKQSRRGDRFGRYLASWRYRGDMEEDFWKRDDEKKERERERERERETERERERDKESVYTTGNTNSSSNVHAVAGAGRRNEGVILPSVLVSEASGNSAITSHRHNYGLGFGFGSGEGGMGSGQSQSPSQANGLAGMVGERDIA